MAIPRRIGISQHAQARLKAIRIYATTPRVGKVAGPAEPRPLGSTRLTALPAELQTEDATI